MNGNGKYHMDCSGLDDGAEGFGKVDTTALIEALGNQAGFEPLDSAILLAFNLVEPFVANNVVMPRAREKSPGTVGKECIKLKAYSSSPFRGCGSLGVAGGLKGGDHSGESSKWMVGGVK